MQQKTRSYVVCLLRHGVLAQTYFFVIWGGYWSFAPLLTSKIKIWKKFKKHQEILSFYTCVPLIKIIHTLDMMYGSWDIKFNRQNYFVILGIFLPFFFKNEKKPLEISSFYTSVPKIIIIRYTVPEIWCDTDVFILGYAFFFYPPKNEI